MADLSTEQFEETYKPIFSAEQYMFDTLKDVQAYMKQNNIEHGKDVYRYIWTVVDEDNGQLVNINGFHLCNRIGYVLCTVPWGTGEESDTDIYIESDY